MITVAVGQPILGWLVGGPVPSAFTPLAVLAVGQLAASIAVASWIVPMMFAGRLLAMIAAVAGVVKLVLLLVLVPRYGAIGAAIATAVGWLIALQGQTLFGARAVKFRPFPASMISVLLLTLAVAAGGRGLFVVLAPHLRELAAVAITAAAALGVLLVGLLVLLDAGDRAELRRLVGIGAPATVAR